MAHCNFCDNQTGEKEWEKFQDLCSIAADPDGDPVDIAGIDFFLYHKTLFIYDICDGYLGESMKVSIKFCPFCGRQL